MVVEDEPAIRELIGFACETAGFQVFRAGTVKEAQSLLAADHADLILLDWMLPDLSGLQWLEQLRRDEKTQGLPVIMLTARGTESDKVAGLEAGRRRLYRQTLLSARIDCPHAGGSAPRAQ